MSTRSQFTRSQHDRIVSCDIKDSHYETRIADLKLDDPFEKLEALRKRIDGKKTALTFGKPLEPLTLNKRAPNSRKPDADRVGSTRGDTDLER